jgi:hypothetical protein
MIIPSKAALAIAMGFLVTAAHAGNVPTLNVKTDMHADRQRQGFPDRHQAMSAIRAGRARSVGERVGELPGG